MQKKKTKRKYRQKLLPHTTPPKALGLDRSRRKLWEQRPDESSKAYRAFCIYRDMGPDRTQHKTLESLGMSPKSYAWFNKLSRDYQWLRRAMAWDMHVDKQRRQAYLQEIRKMGTRQARQMQAFAQALSHPMATYLRRIEKEQKLPPEKRILTRQLEEMDARKLLALIISASSTLPAIHQSERKAMGILEKESAEDAVQGRTLADLIMEAQTLEGDENESE